MHELQAVFSSPWVPAAVISACGFTPVPVNDYSGITKAQKNAPAPSEGICPWSSAFAQFAENGSFDAVIATTTCDQMRRSAELISKNTSRPVFVLNVPSTNSTAALNLYCSELNRLIRFLSAISGIQPAGPELEAAWHRFNGSEHRDDTGSMDRGNKVTIPVCLLGNHLPVPFPELSRILREAGIAIVINGMENGTRIHIRPQRLPDAGNIDNAVSFIAEKYFSGMNDISRRPNIEFYRWLTAELKRQAPRGIIVARNTWCDLWAVETLRIKNLTQLPLLELEFTNHEIPLSMISRIQAFRETCTR